MKIVITLLFSSALYGADIEAMRKYVQSMSAPRVKTNERQGLAEILAGATLSAFLDGVIALATGTDMLPFFLTLTDLSLTFKS